MYNITTRFALALLLTFAAILALGAPIAQAAPPSGRLYLDGQIVRTHVVNEVLPHGGTDPLYQITNGVTGQLGVAADGPGDPNYHGGAWAVYTVTFNDGVTPYLLTSEEDVEQAEADGDITITRHPELDNRCPINR
jgi:hypothetical protein